jgi:hypothetical protein
MREKDQSDLRSLFLVKYFDRHLRAGTPVPDISTVMSTAGWADGTIVIYDFETRGVQYQNRVHRCAPSSASFTL